MEKLRGKIYGQLVDDEGNPLFGIELKAIADYSSFFADDPILGDSITNKNGKFEIYFTLDPKFKENEGNKIKIEFFIDKELIMNISTDIKNEIIDFGVIRFNKGNIGVEGYVVDEKGNPIEGLTVIAEDIDFGKMELNALGLIESRVKSLIKDEGILNSSMDFIKDKYQLLLPFRDDYLGSSVTDKNGYYRIIYPQERYREILDKEPDIRIIVKDKLGVFELRKTKIHNNITNTVETIDNIIINRSELKDGTLL